MTPSPIETVGATPRGNEKIWSILCHLSWFVGLPFLLPLVVYLAMKGDSEYVRGNAGEALNFHLSVIIYAVCCLPFCLVLIGVPMLLLLGAATVILAIVGAFKASDGICYRYPLTIHFV